MYRLFLRVECGFDFCSTCSLGCCHVGVGLGLASIWPRSRYVSACRWSGVVYSCFDCRFGQVHLAFFIVIIEFCLCLFVSQCICICLLLCLKLGRLPSAFVRPRLFNIGIFECVLLDLLDFLDF